MSHSRSFLNLCQCLRNERPAQPDWLELIALANATLTTTHLIEFVRDRPEAVPADVARVVEFLFERNSHRNARLLAQLGEALAALNARGITPVLLKGAALLAASDQERNGRRMAFDLDLLVRPDEVTAALDSLFSLGYSIHGRSPADAGKWWLDLGRANDVGAIDLHISPPGPAFCYAAFGEARAHSLPVTVGRGAAFMPSPARQAWILIAHDQFQDHDYWIGAIDLRHWLDLRGLVSTAGFDWEELAALATGKLGRNALETELAALHGLLGVDVPLNMRRRIWPRFQQQRRMLQLRFPWLTPFLLAAGVPDLIHYRAEVGSREPQTGVRTRRRFLPKADTMRFILDLVRQQRAFKL